MFANERGTGTQVLIGFGLGAVFGVGVGLAFLSETYTDFGLYMIALSLFHFWEYNYVALFHSKELNANSFLLNHSQEYKMAALASWIEYFFERWFFGGSSWKGSFLFLFVGFILTFGGQAIRTLSMYTAGSNFHHLIREEREKDHKLITFGIYQYLRHPSYFGWFWFSIGTQVMLTNPVCIGLYAWASWRFFANRIPEEEATLIEFFGAEYERYRSRTPVGIPLIK